MKVSVHGSADPLLCGVLEFTPAHEATDEHGSDVFWTVSRWLVGETQEPRDLKAEAVMLALGTASIHSKEPPSATDRGRVPGMAVRALMSR